MEETYQTGDPNVVVALGRGVLVIKSCPVSFQASGAILAMAMKIIPTKKSSWISVPTDTDWMFLNLG